MNERSMELIEPICLDAAQSYLDYAMSVISERSRVVIPVVRKVSKRVQRAARAVRSSVRQSFAARTAAKAADGGGGDPDPDGRKHHLTSTTSISRFDLCNGGAK